jgi:hypothetical protein
MYVNILLGTDLGQQGVEVKITVFEIETDVNYS